MNQKNGQCVVFWDGPQEHPNFLCPYYSSYDGAKVVSVEVKSSPTVGFQELGAFFKYFWQAFLITARYGSHNEIVSRTSFPLLMRPCQHVYNYFTYWPLCGLGKNRT